MNNVLPPTYLTLRHLIGQTIQWDTLTLISTDHRSDQATQK